MEPLSQATDSTFCYHVWDKWHMNQTDVSYGSLLSIFVVVLLCNSTCMNTDTSTVKTSETNTAWQPDNMFRKQKLCVNNLSKLADNKSIISS